MDRAMEARHLALADRHIEEGEARVHRQLELISRLEMRGQNTEAAEDFLSLLCATMALWVDEREGIVMELQRQSG